jgi:transketolase
MSVKKPPIKVFGEALVEAGTRNPNVVALSADSSSGSGLGPFKEKFPDRHLEFGIMEQGIIGYASGLATAGKIPFVAAIAPFVTSRPFEMFRNDLGYMRQNVKVVGRCAGFTYSAFGPTHQSLEDLAIIRTIPGVVVLNPGDPVSITKATLAAAQHEGPVYLRIGSQDMPVLHPENLDFKIGRGVEMTDGNDGTIIGTGTVLQRAQEAVEILAKQGIKVRLIDLHTIKPLDREIVLRAARETGKIVTVEEHYTFGGLGGAVAELLATEHPTPMKILGVDDRFAPNGPYDEVLGAFGLQGHQIAETVRDFLKR